MNPEKIAELAAMIANLGDDLFPGSNSDPREIMIINILLRKMPEKPADKETITNILNEFFEGNERYGEIVLEIWEKRGSDFEAMLSMARKLIRAEH